MVRNYEMTLEITFGESGWREETGWSISARFILFLVGYYILLLYPVYLKRLATMSKHAPPCPSFPIIGLAFFPAKEWRNLGRLMTGLTPPMYPETMPASQIPAQF